MNNYSQHLFLFLKRFIWLLVLYTISRLFFLLINAGYFSGISFTEIIRIFAAGVRFDIAAIVFTNAIFIIFILPGAYKNHPVVQHVFTILFFTVNSLALLGNFIDARFFDFINKRSTSSIFSLMSANEDVWLLIPLFIKDYWYVALSWLVLIIVFWRYMPRLQFEKLNDQRMTLSTFMVQFLLFVLVTGLMLLGARGTKLKPIGIIDATNYTELKHAPLILNTPFSIIKTIENENVEPYAFFDRDTLSKIYQPVHHYSSTDSMKKLNVVVFILESFAKEYSGYLSGRDGFTPCFDSLLNHSLVYYNAYANGTQSFEAMPAIIAGIPSLMDRPYSGSNYVDNLIESLPGLLRKEGYYTAFFHGGNNGTMRFDNFARAAGIEHYMGRDEYNNDADYDGHWGIWDEPYLQYFARQMDQLRQPFFTAVFTLSSHHPYNVPDKYKDRFREGRLPIHKSIEYADFALGRFFETARDMDWFKNTLFVFTADHAAQAEEIEYNSTTGMYAIPIAFYCPADSSMRGIDSTVAQQIDIMPTVLHYLDYQKPFFAFGESLMDKTASHRAISFVNGIYQLIEESYVMLFNGKKVISFYNAELQDEKKGVDSPDKITDPTAKEVFVRMKSNLKAILQTYNYCLINNKTTLDQYDQSNAQNPFEIHANHLP